MSQFVSYLRPDQTIAWGRLEDETIYDATSQAPSLAAAIAAGALPGLAGHTENPVALDDVELAPVIPEPGKIICIGVNYRSHQDEIGKAAPEAPVVFARYADSQMGHGADALKPASSAQFDYEGELALVISEPAHKVAREDAYDHVAGYAVYNDFSVRDWQRAASQWLPGKTWPGTGGFGPALVTPDEVGDVTELEVTTRVNGEVRQKGKVADLINDIPAIIEYVTTFTPLSPGDVIVTGTPGGVGLFMDPQGFIVDGDVVEVEITRLGTLRNTVRDV
ncbi:2-keto-4-pentenoate hydratase/2-oxohepta-3-ene-1,7-dioic acid hydratase in catechol pathway [Nocardioides luteus]|nr:fumarylacetoacetate hydrolase family protein [Nocardioides luteus]MDR7310330.1 2-keto-4-pentenoate hydratase/2-oxohepta-3-ene-1,7-dioic acid hydratase in catechol pathway [Nocardioides luteus]